MSYRTVTLDSNGQATVSVTRSESNLDYFQAAVADDSGDTGQASNVVVLNNAESAGQARILHRVNAGEGTTVSAADGPTGSALQTRVRGISRPSIPPAAVTTVGALKSLPSTRFPAARRLASGTANGTGT